MKKIYIIVVVVLSFALLIGGHAFADTWGITPGDGVDWHPVGPALVGKFVYYPVVGDSGEFQFLGTCKGDVAEYWGDHLILSFENVESDLIDGTVSDILASAFGDRCLPNPKAAVPDALGKYSVIINNVRNLVVENDSGNLTFDAVVLFVAY